MPKLPRITSKKLVRVLLKSGFILRRQTGSHAILKHPDGMMVVVPIHAGDLKVGTLSGILDDARMTIEELISAL